MTVRQPTAVDALADAYTARFAELDPIAATDMGIPGHDHQMTDLSPDGHAELARLDRETLAALRAVAAADEIDRMTIAAMTDRLGLAQELHESGELLATLNVIASPVQELRDVLDLMPTATTDDWANIASRVSRVPEAVARLHRVAADGGPPRAGGRGTPGGGVHRAGRGARRPGVVVLRHLPGRRPAGRRARVRRPGR